jgi:hypothetical protein
MICAASAPAVAGEPRTEGCPRTTNGLRTDDAGTEGRDAWSAGAGVIEIEFAAGARLRITGAVDAATRDGGRGVG